MDANIKISGIRIKIRIRYSYVGKQKGSEKKAQKKNPFSEKVHKRNTIVIE